MFCDDYFPETDAREDRINQMFWPLGGWLLEASETVIFLSNTVHPQASLWGSDTYPTLDIDIF